MHGNSTTEMQLFCFKMQWPLLLVHCMDYGNDCRQRPF